LLTECYGIMSELEIFLWKYYGTKHGIPVDTRLSKSKGKTECDLIDKRTGMRIEIVTSDHISFQCRKHLNELIKNRELLKESKRNKCSQVTGAANKFWQGKQIQEMQLFFEGKCFQDSMNIIHALDAFLKQYYRTVHSTDVPEKIAESDEVAFECQTHINTIKEQMRLLTENASTNHTELAGVVEDGYIFHKSQSVRLCLRQMDAVVKFVDTLKSSVQKDNTATDSANFRHILTSHKKITQLLTNPESKDIIKLKEKTQLELNRMYMESNQTLSMILVLTTNELRDIQKYLHVDETIETGSQNTSDQELLNMIKYCLNVRIRNVGIPKLAEFEKIIKKAHVQSRNSNENCI